MNVQEYVKLKVENTVNEESWDSLAWKLAFIEFDCELEEYVENERERDNGGRSLMDVSVQEVEAILNRYIERTEDELCRYRTEQMRNAIQDVTGLVC